MCKNFENLKRGFNKEKMPNFKLKPFNLKKKTEIQIKIKLNNTLLI